MFKWLKAVSVSEFLISETIHYIFLFTYCYFIIKFYHFIFNNKIERKCALIYLFSFQILLLLLLMRCGKYGLRREKLNITKCDETCMNTRAVVIHKLISLLHHYLLLFIAIILFYHLYPSY